MIRIWGCMYSSRFPLTMATCMECLSASLYTATERTPIFLAVRITRHAISPLLAMRTFSIRPAHWETTPASVLMNYNNNVHYVGNNSSYPRMHVWWILWSRSVSCRQESTRSYFMCLVNRIWMESRARSSAEVTSSFHVQPQCILITERCWITEN